MTAPANDLHVYLWYGWDPHTDYTTECLLYEGKSRRRPFARIHEHREKPWEDTYTRHERDPRVFRDEAELAEAEEAAIRADRPLYNDQFNRDNPRRIDYDTQVRQRHARDDAAGRPRWQPSGRRPVRRTPASRPPSRLTPEQRETRLRLVGYAAVWAGLAVGAWFGLPHLALPNGPAWTSVTASGALVFGRSAWWFVRLPTRRRRRLVRTAWAALRLAALLFVVGAVVVAYRLHR